MIVTDPESGLRLPLPEMGTVPIDTFTPAAPRALSVANFGSGCTFAAGSIDDSAVSCSGSGIGAGAGAGAAAGSTDAEAGAGSGTGAAADLTPTGPSSKAIPHAVVCGGIVCAVCVCGGGV